MFLITQSDLSSKNELLDWSMGREQEENPPSVQALVKQRAKLLPAGMQAVLHAYTRLTEDIPAAVPPEGLADDNSDYRFLAVDGSTCTFSSDHRHAGPEYYSPSKPNQRGTYSMHLTALQDLHRRTFIDGIIKLLHQQDERKALRELSDSYVPASPDERSVFILDCGYASYNVLTHILEPSVLCTSG